MRKTNEIFIDDEHGIYTIIEIDSQLISFFFDNLLRKVFYKQEKSNEPAHLLKRKQAEKKPNIVSSAVFIDNEYGIAKIVLFFSRINDFYIIESYLKKLKRKYKIDTTINYENLIDLAYKNPSRFWYISPFQNPWMTINNDDVMTLWIYTNHNQIKSD